MKNKFQIALTLAVIMAMAMTSLALADVVTSDVILATAGNQTLINLGTVTPGQIINTSTSFQLVCNGSNHADSGNTVDVQYFSATIPGGTLTAGNTTIGPIPASWADDSGNCSSPAPVLDDNGNSSVVITAPTLAGTYNYVVTYKVCQSNTATLCGGIEPNDVTGSVPDVTFRLTVVTNTPPSVSVTGVSNGSSYEFGSVPAAGCSVTDTQDGNSSFAASLSAITGTLSAYGLGSQTASCSYTDGGGLTGSASATYSIVDTTKPTIDAHGDETAEATGPGGAVVNYTSPASHDAVFGNGTASCAPASGTLFALGNTTVTCNATDGAGNAAIATTFVVHVVDTTPPVVTVPLDITAEATGPAGAVVSFSASASDIVDGAITPTCVPASGSTFPLGTTLVTCSATDAHGNPGSDSFNVTVQDTTDPMIDDNADVVLEATGPSGAVATFSNPAASDIVDTNVAVVCVPASGSTFALGTATVTCTATDDSGNSAQSAFDVTVQDTTDPTIDDNADLVLEATGPSGAVATFTNPAASDIVDTNVDVVCAPASGSTFALGTATVTCTATDDSGNSAQSDFDVTVQDTTPPVIAFVSRTAANVAGWNNTNVVVNWSCTDLVGVVSASVSTTVSTEGAGQSAIGTCEDTSGNTASDTQTGINIDKTKPTIVAAISAGSLGLNGWYVSDVTVHFTCADNLSGVVACPADQTLSAEGTGISSTAQTIADVAGNSSDASNVVSVNIDKTKPVITITTPPNGASYLLNQAVASNYDCSDATSDIATCAGPVASGLNIYTASTGSHSFTVNASDAAGNTNSATNNYSVAFKICVLYDQTKAHKLGSTVPLKLQLCDVNGVNYSSASIIVKATTVTKIDNTAGPLDDSGAANSPDMNFRYDATLGGTGGYIFNLSTKGLSSGTWKVAFTINGASGYFVTFDVK